MMEAVKKGQDRQAIHEIIREYSQMCADEVKLGKENRLLELIQNDERFHLSKEELKEILNPKRFIGLSEEQTVDFIHEYVDPLIHKYHKTNTTVELKI